MEAQRAGREQGAPASGDTPDGFAVAVVHENATWRCSAMSPEALTSLAVAETELRELRSAGAVLEHLVNFLFGNRKLVSYFTETNFIHEI